MVKGDHVMKCVDIESTFCLPEGNKKTKDSCTSKATTLRLKVQNECEIRGLTEVLECQLLMITDLEETGTIAVRDYTDAEFNGQVVKQAWLATCKLEVAEEIEAVTA